RRPAPSRKKIKILEIQNKPKAASKTSGRSRVTGKSFTPYTLSPHSPWNRPLHLRFHLHDDIFSCPPYGSRKLLHRKLRAIAQHEAHHSNVAPHLHDLYCLHFKLQICRRTDSRLFTRAKIFMNMNFLSKSAYHSF